MPGALVALAERLQGICLGRGHHRRGRRVVHGRPRRLHDHGGARLVGLLPGRRRVVRERGQGGAARASPRRCSRPMAPSAPRWRSRWRPARGRDSMRRSPCRSRASPARMAGAEAKPVGLTYVGLADRSPARTVRRFTFSHDRAGNREAAAREALAGSSSARRPARRDPDRGRARRRPRPRPRRPGRSGPASESTSWASRAPARPRRRSMRLAQGAIVTGCDPGGPSPYTPALEALRIPIAWSHHASHVTDGPPLDRLAVTKALTAVAPDHPELRAAAQPRHPRRAVAAGRSPTRHHGRNLIAVAGTHGKSTTSGWLDLGARRGRPRSIGVRGRAAAGSADRRAAGDGAGRAGRRRSSSRRTSTPATSTRTGPTSSCSRRSSGTTPTSSPIAPR